MLEFKNQSTNTGDSTNYLGENIFYNEGVITKARDDSDTSDNKFDNDLAIYLEMKVENLENPKIVTITGDFKKDAAGQITDWGGAFKIQKLIQACGISNGTLNEKYRVDKSIIEEMVGKKVSYLQYKKKDGKWKVWQTFYHPGSFTDRNELKSAFLKYVNNIKGYSAGQTWEYDPGSNMPNNSPPSASAAGEPWKQTNNQSVSNGVPSFMK